MTKHSRRTSLRSLFSLGVSGGRRGAEPRSHREQSRRRLLAERLENRALMAADLNVWHNELFPVDVDGDVQISPLDALIVINDLNSNGARQLPTTGANSAEGRIDVNGDGFASPQDALTIINELNGEGEPIIVQFGLTTVGLSTTTPLTTVQVGEHFRVRATVDDLRSTGGGVFAAYLDLVYSGNIQPVVRENQRIEITGSPTGGTFTLTFNGQTTAPIAFETDEFGNPTGPTTTVVRQALEALSNIDPGEVDVTIGPTPFSSWDVKFGGSRYGNTNVANMTATSSLTGGSGVAIGVTELPGRVDLGVGETDSLVRSVTYGPSYPNAPSASDGQFDPAIANMLDEIGAFAGTTPVGPNTLLLFSVEFKAIAPGVVNFTTDPADVLPAHNVLMFGSSGAVAAADIIYPTHSSLTVVQVADAVDDTGAATEDQTTFTRVNVLANDTVASGTKQIQSFTQGANGTVQRFTNGTATNFADDQLEYRPNANFAGTDTFTYVLSNGSGNTDTATVTITVAAVNDAPTIAGPTTGTTNEDTAFAFTGGNAVTVADIDAGTANISVAATSTNGVVAVGGGFSGLISAGSNSSTALTLTGTLSQVNSALASLTYTPTLNSTAAGQVVLTVNDNGNTGSGGARTASRTTAITVTAQNDAPVNSLPAAPNTLESTPLVFSTANSNAITVSDVDAGTSNVQITLGVQNGVLALGTTAGLASSSGNNSANVTLTGTIAALNTALNGLTYTPTTNYVGESILTITTNDQGATGAGGAKTDVDQLTINVIPNVRPRAINDTATVGEDSSSNVIVVATNDILNPGSTIILISSSASANGGTTSISGNTILYTPAANYFGSDSFTYVINDTSGDGANSTGTVNVTVTAVNDAPTATDDTASTNEDTALTIAATSLTSNDSPGPGEASQPIAVTGVSATSANGGTVTLAAGQITYTPAANYNGEDTFTYTITDSGASFGTPTGLTATATVTVTVSAVNDNPVAGNDAAGGVEDQPTTVSLSSLLANDGPGGGADEAGQTLSVQSVAATSSAGGTVTTDANNLVFTAPADFNGSATITYVVADNGSPTGTATGTLTITVSEVNDAPTANNDSLTGVKNIAKVFPASALLGNDSKGPANENGQTLRITSVTSPSANGGTVVLNGDGSVTYTPPANSIAPDSFSYTVSDDGTTDGDPDHKTDTATANISILDFIPMTVSGIVYFDLDTDGVKDAAEPGIAGVEVTLTGEDFEGAPVGPIVAVTDRNGNYSFTDLAPGDYLITETQPANTTDGGESVGNPLTVHANDTLRLNVSVEDNVDLPTHVLTGNNFGERGFSSAFGGVGATIDLLASSSDPGSELSQGVVFAYTNSSATTVAWHRFLYGWDGYLSADLKLAADRLSAELTVVDGSNRTWTATVTTASARLRIRTDGFGNVVVHVVGDPFDFPLVESGNGEGPDAVDAAFASGDDWL